MYLFSSGARHNKKTQALDSVESNFEAVRSFQIRSDI